MSFILEPIGSDGRRRLVVEQSVPIDLGRNPEYGIKDPFVARKHCTLRWEASSSGEVVAQLTAHRKTYVKNSTTGILRLVAAGGTVQLREGDSLYLACRKDTPPCGYRLARSDGLGSPARKRPRLAETPVAHAGASQAGATDGKTGPLLVATGAGTAAEEPGSGNSISAAPSAGLMAQPGGPLSPAPPASRAAGRAAGAVAAGVAAAPRALIAPLPLPHSTAQHRAPAAAGPSTTAADADAHAPAALRGSGVQAQRQVAADASPSARGHHHQQPDAAGPPERQAAGAASAAAVATTATATDAVGVVQGAAAAHTAAAAAPATTTATNDVDVPPGAAAAPTPAAAATAAAGRRVVLLMVGVPGSGKSTFCQRLQERAGETGNRRWCRVNQDTIRNGKPGSRQQCIAAAEQALGKGQSVLVDRCNPSAKQRAEFIQLAARNSAEAHVVVLGLPIAICKQRAEARVDHEGGLEGKGKIAMAIGGVSKEMQRARATEGLQSILECRNDAEVSAAVQAWAQASRDPSIDPHPLWLERCRATRQAAAAALLSGRAGRSPADGGGARAAAGSGGGGAQAAGSSDAAGFSGQGPLRQQAQQGWRRGTVPAVASPSRGGGGGGNCDTRGGGGNSGVSGSGRRHGAQAEQSSAPDPRAAGKGGADSGSAAGKADAFALLMQTAARKRGGALSPVAGKQQRLPGAAAPAGGATDSTGKQAGPRQQQQQHPPGPTPAAGGAAAGSGKQAGQSAASGSSGKQAGQQQQQQQQHFEGGAKMGPWADALRKVALDPKGSAGKALKTTDRCVLVLDAYPKSRCHALVVARDPALLSPSDLRAEHVPLVLHMKEVGEAWAAQQQQQCRDQGAPPPGLPFRLGFHSLPSMRQLHLHVISCDMDSAALKNKKHWNSFTTRFFIDVDTVLEQLRSSHGRLQIDAPANEALLRQDLRCHRCGVKAGNMPKLKGHLANCRRQIPEPWL